jgi:outer membrane protein assembly factor BamA
MRLLLDSSIRPLYEAQGRLRVSFPSVKAEPSPREVQGLNVTVEVSEGPVFNFGSIRVEGTASMNQRLGEVAKLESGTLANFNQVRVAVERIDGEMRERGYMGVSTEVERNIRDDRGTVDLVLRVNPGPQYVFGRLTIEGLDINGEAEIRRIWGLEQGEPFRPSYPDYFLQQVQEQGVFDYLRETRSAISVDDATQTVDVTLIFNPEPEWRIPSTFDDPRSGN